MKNCISCGAELKDDAIFCFNCGAQQGSPEGAPQPIPTPVPAQSDVAGYPYPAPAPDTVPYPDAAPYTQPQQPYAAYPYAAPAAPKKSKKPLFIALGAGAVALIFIIVIVLVLVLGSSGGAKSTQELVDKVEKALTAHDIDGVSNLFPEFQRDTIKYEISRDPDDLFGEYPNATFTFDPSPYDVRVYDRSDILDIENSIYMATGQRVEIEDACRIYYNATVFVEEYNYTRSRDFNSICIKIKGKWYFYER